MFVSAAHGVSCKSKKSLRDGEKGEGEKGKVSFPFPFRLSPFPYFCNKSNIVECTTQRERTFNRS